MRCCLQLVLVGWAAGVAVHPDLRWVDQPQSWHQQAIRIVDHPFSTIAELRAFGLAAKKAGVSVVQLVGPQKKDKCVGYWYGGLALCDHINGTFPAGEGSLEEWQQMLAEIRPVRLMWWSNFAYWSTQGQVWAEARADPDSEVGRFFSYAPAGSELAVCPGKWLGNQSDPTNPSYGYRNTCFEDQSGRKVCAQGSFGSVAGNCTLGRSNRSTCFDDTKMGCRQGAGECIQSVNANPGHKEYADYLADALANSWSRNLGIDGWIVDTSFQSPCAPGTNSDYGAPGGTEYIFYNQIIGKVRESQPQVVLSGEDCASWDDAITHNFQLPGTKASAAYTQALQDAVQAGDLDSIEEVVADSGGDAASLICYLHPGLDGKQPGACPTLYYRDTGPTYPMERLGEYRLWVALEAASGILSEHQKSPTAVFGQAPGSWNVTMDPFRDDGEESPLWGFARNRALNRLALRTKLPVAAAGAASSGGALAYLKHDSLGPHGDAAVVLFNPNAAQNLTVDLSMLPDALLAGHLVPVDLFTNASAPSALAANWTVRMDATSFVAFGFQLGVFAPYHGKFKSCRADDGYSRNDASATTLQACFLACKRDQRCENIFVATDALPKWLEKPSSISCTLLGQVASPTTSCPETGSGTLIAALTGPRPVLNLSDVPTPR